MKDAFPARWLGAFEHGVPSKVFSKRLSAWGQSGEGVDSDLQGSCSSGNVGYEPNLSDDPLKICSFFIQHE